MNYKLYAHQKKIIDDAPSRTGLFWGCGTGKTLASMKLAEKKNKDTIIICPKSLQKNWKRELTKFQENDIDFLIISKENFKKNLKELPPRQTMIWDEAHHASGLKSQIHKATIQYIKKWNVENIYPLTATPYMASCWSVFALAKILGRDWEWHKWNRAFFDTFKLGPKPPPGVKDRRRRISKQKSNIELRIARIVSRIGVTARIEDLFDVPEQVFKDEYFDLTAEQKKAMGSIIETNPAVEHAKCHQICGGTLKGDGYVEDQFFKSEKLNRTIELCKQNKKIAIVCRYNNEVNYIHDKVQAKLKGRRVYTINGAVKDKDPVVQAIEKDEECVVVINASCSEGYNMPSVPVMIFYSLSFKWLDYEQVCGRILRADSLKSNLYIHMRVNYDTDEAVYRNIMNKQNFHMEIYAYNKTAKKL